jgi:hypothetical protein
LGSKTTIDNIDNVKTTKRKPYTYKKTQKNTQNTGQDSNIGQNNPNSPQNSTSCSERLTSMVTDGEMVDITRPLPPPPQLPGVSGGVGNETANNDHNNDHNNNGMYNNINSAIVLGPESAVSNIINPVNNITSLVAGGNEDSIDETRDDIIVEIDRNDNNTHIYNVSEHNTSCLDHIDHQLAQNEDVSMKTQLENIDKLLPDLLNDSPRLTKSLSEENEGELLRISSQLVDSVGKNNENSIFEHNFDNFAAQNQAMNDDDDTKIDHNNTTIIMSTTGSDVNSDVSTHLNSQLDDLDMNSTNLTNLPKNEQNIRASQMSSPINTSGAVLENVDENLVQNSVLDPSHQNPPTTSINQPGFDDDDNDDNNNNNTTMVIMTEPAVYKTISTTTTENSTTTTTIITTTTYTTTTTTSNPPSTPWSGSIGGSGGNNQNNIGQNNNSNNNVGKNGEFLLDKNNNFNNFGENIQILRRNDQSNSQPSRKPPQSTKTTISNRRDQAATDYTHIPKEPSIKPVHSGAKQPTQPSQPQQHQHYAYQSPAVPPSRQYAPFNQFQAHEAETRTIPMIQSTALTPRGLPPLVTITVDRTLLLGQTRVMNSKQYHHNGFDYMKRLSTPSRWLEGISPYRDELLFPGVYGHGNGINYKNLNGNNFGQKNTQNFGSNHFYQNHCFNNDLNFNSNKWSGSSFNLHNNPNNIHNKPTATPTNNILMESMVGHGPYNQTKLTFPVVLDFSPYLSLPPEHFFNQTGKNGQIINHVALKQLLSTQTTMKKDPHTGATVYNQRDFEHFYILRNIIIRIDSPDLTQSSSAARIAGESLELPPVRGDSGSNGINSVDFDPNDNNLNSNSSTQLKYPHPFPTYISLSSFPADNGALLWAHHLIPASTPLNANPIDNINNELESALIPRQYGVEDLYWYSINNHRIDPMPLDAILNADGYMFYFEKFDPTPVLKEYIQAHTALRNTTAVNTTSNGAEQTQA